MPGYSLQSHESAGRVWWECLRDGCANKIVEGQPPPICYHTVKMYSTDISAAWDIVRHLNKRGYGFALLLDWHGPKVAGRGFATASFRPLFMEDVGAESAPLAVCLAALKAVGYVDELFEKSAEVAMRQDFNENEIEHDIAEAVKEVRKERSDDDDN